MCGEHLLYPHGLPPSCTVQTNGWGQLTGLQIQWDNFRKPSDVAADKWAAVEISKKRTVSDGHEYLVQLTLPPSQLYDEVGPGLCALFQTALL